MVAVLIERDRRLAQRLAAALGARGVRTRVAHGYREGRALLRRVVPQALYVSEMLQRLSGGDLLAEAGRDDQLATLPTLVRVTNERSLFARAMRSGGARTIVAPFDVERVAAILVAMMTEPHDSFARRLLVSASHLREHARDLRDRTLRQTRRTHELIGAAKKFAMTTAKRR
ncbi:MAG: hypothetical protein JWN44_2490 [Myxococcales bacterium]|nr:hypothetical protein [Myxococcales bacterium]